MSAPPPSAPEPLSFAEFAAAMAALGPFERAPRLAVAVSGGPDSMALALLAARWAGQRGGTVLGLTVDHGLRPESAAEAGQVVAWLHARGIPCRVLPWTGPKPASGVQAAARAARYALLAAACREAGILHLLLAHHALDQAETACMRAEAGSGELGLSGMAAIGERVGLRLLRPLLRTAPERLKAALAAMGQPWLDDPSNAALRFRRARLRAEVGFDRDGWLAEAEAAAARRALLDETLARFAAEAIAPDPLGYLGIALERWHELPQPLAEAALARCILAVSGQPYPPARAGIEGLARRLRQGLAGATLGGSVLLTRAGRLLVVREPARIRDCRELAPGAGILWDGRFLVRRGPGSCTMLAAPLGASGRLLLPPEVRDRLRARRVPAAAIAALPSLWQDGRLLASPLHAVGDGAGAELTLKPLLPVAPAPFAGPNVV